MIGIEYGSMGIGGRGEGKEEYDGEMGGGYVGLMGYVNRVDEDGGDYVGKGWSGEELEMKKVVEGEGLGGEGDGEGKVGLG